jgi:two-component system sensor histidine kinase RegB
MRWFGVLGQLGAVLVAWGILRADLPFALLLALIAASAVSNGALALHVGARTSAARPAALAPATTVVFGVLVVDVALLTAILLASGGPANPFTIFYAVHVAVAALLLRPALAWAMVALTTAGFGALFFLPAHPLSGRIPLWGWSLHLGGMWVSYALAAGFVASFVGRVAAAIRERDRARADADRLARQNERLATLTAFSAAAAHELGSPLGTIALAAAEAARRLERSPGADPAVVEDVALVRAEVARCRAILADIASRAGESTGEMPETLGAPELATALREALAPGARALVEVAVEPGAPAVRVPPRTAVRMVHNLVRNALDAHERAASGRAAREGVAPARDARDPDAAVGGAGALGGDPDPGTGAFAGAGSLPRVLVTLRPGAAGRALEVAVADRGPGMPAEVRARVGEPFLSTGPGGGLGLGLYLARSFAERLGGTLTLDDRPGGGTIARLRLPAAPVPGGAAGPR